MNGESVVDSNIAYVDVPTKTSELENDSNFIDESVLTEYRTAEEQEVIDNTINERINAISGLGRFLSGWDSTTGLATTNPQENPYSYPNGSFYIVAKVGETNYKPNGDKYTIGVASETIETQAVKVGDVYKYDGTNWDLITLDAPVIAQFSNETMGTILGSTNAGYISAQEDGTGKVNGFENKADKSDTMDLSTDQTAEGDKTFFGQTKFQNGGASGCVVFGGDVAGTGITSGTRKLARFTFPTKLNGTGETNNNLNCAAFSCDTQGTGGSTELDLNIVELGGRTGDVTSTSPDRITFTVANVHNSTTDKREILSADKSAFNMKVQPQYNGTNLATKSSTLAGYGITNAYTKAEIGTNTITLTGTYDDGSTFTATLKGVLTNA